MRTQLKIDFDVDAWDIFGESNLTGTAERNLLLAVLERATLDYVGNDKAEREAATEWIFSDNNCPDDSYQDDDEELFTFAWICTQLDLNPGEIAEKISKMPRRGNKRIAPWYFTRKG